MVPNTAGLEVLTELADEHLAAGIGNDIKFILLIANSRTHCATEHEGIPVECTA